jgi:hypothetical protein
MGHTTGDNRSVVEVKAEAAQGPEEVAGVAAVLTSSS